MPRQPYLPNFSRFHYGISALALNDRPEFCAAIGKCIAIWSHVDHEMGNLLGILLGTETEAALEVFLSLRKASNQREALDAAARHKLATDQKKVFNALLKVYGSLESQRNDLAHGCFGICPENSEILFWIELKNYVHFNVEAQANIAKGKFEGDMHARLKSNLFVFRKEDLKLLYSQMEEFWWAICYFNEHLRNPDNKDWQSKYVLLQDYEQIRHALKSAEQ